MVRGSLDYILLLIETADYSSKGAEAIDTENSKCLVVVVLI